MVATTQQAGFPSGTEFSDAAAWLEAAALFYTPDGIALIRAACELADPLYAEKAELTGTPLMRHALGSAAILAGMGMDHETITAAILHAVPDFLEDWQEVLAERFGGGVKTLVEGISRMEHIRQFSEMAPDGKKDADEAAHQVENLRKMLLAMVEDIRVVFIKLAERTQTLRKLSGVPTELQQAIASETRSIFAPLANRLGVWQLKWELEDLSMRYLEPELYKKVAKLLDERRVDRERYITDVIARLEQALHEAGIAGEVSGRPKHIYSIINKMRRKQIGFGELYDVRAVRILVDGIGDCYAALSKVHELWTPIDSEFDDYIANPKPNGYRSLHTAVTGPRDLALEVQIRTRDMHHDSELGVAAHWRYKEGCRSGSGLDDRIAWLRQILAWKNELADSGSMQEQFRNELLHDRIYVFTPQGRVIDLPTGATPVDFAYALHTDLGHRTRGAKVDGGIVPLNYKLQTAQRVDILTVKQGGPSRDWANPSLGFLQSPRARAKVRAWFRSQNIEGDIAQGRAQLDKELHRLGVTSINQEKLAQRLHYNKLDDLLAAIGRNELTPRRIAAAIQEELPTRVIEAARPVAVTKPATQRAGKTDITVGGVNNLMTRVAKCCTPVHGDEIVGYITRDRGITIHRADCAFMLRMTEDRPERRLKAKW